MRAPLTLLLLVSVLGLAACGGDDSKTVTTTVTTPPTTPTTPTAPTTPTTPTTDTTNSGGAPNPGAPTKVVHLDSFKTPSGNIGCSLAGNVARCDIKAKDWDPGARPAGCPSEVDFGQGVEVSNSGKGKIVCAGDTALDPTAPTLAYGSNSTVGDYDCASRENGVTCINNGDGHGFFIAKDRYQLF